MSELKTVENDASVQEFINAIEDDARRNDAVALLQMIKEITGEPAKMWGTQLIGFGRYHYKYASGREGDWFLTGFSPRKQNLSIYIMPGFEQFATILGRLGPYKTGKSCLYIKKLEEVDKEALKDLIRSSHEAMKKQYGIE